MQILRPSKVDTIEGKELTEPSYEICEVDTMTDIDGKEVQIPRAVQVTTKTDIQAKIADLQKQIDELNGHLTEAGKIDAKPKEIIDDKSGSV